VSWVVEGRSYHDYQEYLQARARHESERARNAASELERSNNRLAEEIRRDRARLGDMRDDLAQQTAITRRIHSNVQAIERNQQRLTGLIQQVDQRLSQGIEELERELQAQDGKLHGVQTDVTTLRRTHEQHAAQIRRELSAVNARLEQGFAEAEASRRDTEQRLQASIRSVADDVEHDRCERAAKVSDQMALATAEVDAAELAVTTVTSRAAALDLGSTLSQVQAALAAAQVLRAQQNASAALATSVAARAQADALVHEARNRSADLDAAREEVSQRVAAAEQRLRDDASEELKACFPVESRVVLSRLDAARDRLRNRYLNHRLLEIERREDRELLDQAENDVIDMVARAPVVADAAALRIASLTQLLDDLEQTLGEAGQIEQQFAIPDDPKSDLIVDLAFGSSRARLRSGLDGRLSIDGHHYDNNSACASAATHIVEALQRSMLVQTTRTETTGTPRTAPMQTLKDVMR
jgi:hypothetical protein